MPMSEVTVAVSAARDVVPPLPLTRIERAVRRVLAAEAVGAAELSIALVGDAEIAQLNAQYLGHEGPTDVISFALHEPGEPPLGDIYIGSEQARRQAPSFGATEAEEILRLAVHGTLHALGYDHPTGEDRAECEMFRRQEILLHDLLRENAE